MNKQPKWDYLNNLPDKTIERSIADIYSQVTDAKIKYMLTVEATLIEVLGSEAAVLEAIKSKRLTRTKVIDDHPLNEQIHLDGALVAEFKVEMTPFDNGTN